MDLTVLGVNSDLKSELKVEYFAALHSSVKLSH